MSKTKILALIVAVIGSLLYLKTNFFSTLSWEKYLDAGQAALMKKNYAEAEQKLRQALKEAENFSEGDPRLRLTVANLAKTYREQGKDAEAMPFYKRILAIDEKTLGPEHPVVAASLNNLANNYRIRGKYAEAEPLYRRALEIWVKILGPDDLLVAHVEESYADTLRNMGRVPEAEKLEAHVKSIEAKQKNNDSSP